MLTMMLTVFPGTLMMMLGEAADVFRCLVNIAYPGRIRSVSVFRMMLFRTACNALFEQHTLSFYYVLSRTHAASSPMRTPALTYALPSSAPIIFTTRRQATSDCPFEYSTQWLQELQTAVKESQCAPPYQCPEEVSAAISLRACYAMAAISLRAMPCPVLAHSVSVQRRYQSTHLLSHVRY
eukprot:1366130-Rhodomonas_salina.2